VCPSVRKEQLGLHWKDSHEIWYLNIFRKYVENAKVALKSDTNNGYLEMRNVLHKSCRENQNTGYVQHHFFLIRAIYEIMWKNVVQLVKPQKPIWRMRVAH